MFVRDDKQRGFIIEVVQVTTSIWIYNQQVFEKGDIPLSGPVWFIGLTNHIAALRGPQTPM